MSIKKILNNIVDGFTALVASISLLISGADTLGFLGDATLRAYPFINTVMNNFPKITLLLLSAYIIVYIYEKKAFTENTNNTINIIKSNTEIIPLIQEQTQKLSHNQTEILILKNRSEKYIALKNNIMNLPYATLVCVSHFEKKRSVWYDGGEDIEEENFMRVWKDKVESRSINVQQIVHLLSDYDLAEIKERINKYKNQPNYSINMLYGQPIVPFYDIVIAKGHWVFFSLPTDPSTPLSGDIGVFILNKDVANVFDNFWQVGWSKSISIVNRDSENIRSINFMEDIAIPQDKEEHILKAVEFAMKALKNDNLQFYQEINDIINLFDSILLEELYKEPFKVEVRNKINTFFKPLKIEKGNETLIKIYNSAQTIIKAISLELTDSSFWNSSFGKTLLHENEMAIRNGIEIERIFILSSNLYDNKFLVSILEKHHNAGVIVHIAKIDDVNIDNRYDFLIIDEKLVYNFISFRNNSIENSTLSIHKETLKKFKKTFDKTKLISVPFEVYLK